MNAVGIDVSKGKSKVAIIRSFGEVVAKPFDIMHFPDQLAELAEYIHSLEGESRVVMEHTGKYSEPIANFLCGAGIFVCMVNAKLIHDYGGDTIRRDKTDKVDALKIAGFCLDKWAKLSRYEPTPDNRRMLKTYNRQLSEYTKIKTMLKNNLISLLDQTFPGANELFSSPAREKDGHEKWIDFVAAFPHCHCVASLSRERFAAKYEKWCRKNRYNFCPHKAAEVYSAALNCLPTLPNNDFATNLIIQMVNQLNNLCQTVAGVKAEMSNLAIALPEYDTVFAMHGVGKTLAPQLIAEIGDINCFPKRSSLARFAGIEPPSNQSGTYNQHSRRISKQGSPHLRKALFQVMCCVLQNSNLNEPTFQFIDRKRSEGKPYKVYMIAGANKFLRIYYSRVKECIEKLEKSDILLEQTA
ncbi:MAG: IS110 family transposase [Firmicutes bacterium]|nr:IS110 family transposase [Bacillota bacterium]